MVWLRIDADAPLSPKVASLKSDTLRWIWFETICASKRQKVGGLFSTSALWLKMVNPSLRSALDDLIAAGLVERGNALCPRCIEAYGAVKKEALVIHDFHEYNVDATSTHRTRKFRERLRATVEAAQERSGNVSGTLQERTTVRNGTETNTNTSGLFVKPRSTFRERTTESVGSTLSKMLKD